MAKPIILKYDSLIPAAQAMFTNLLSTWDIAKREAAVAEEKAEKARLALVEHFFKDNLSEGDNTADIGFGKKLVIKKPVYRTISADGAAALDAAIAAGAIPTHLLGAFVKYSPEVVTGEWKKATDEDRAHFKDIVTVKEGKISFSIEVKKS